MASFDLFEHQINQFGAVTVLDVILRDVKDKKPLCLIRGRTILPAPSQILRPATIRLADTGQKAR